MDSIGNLVAGIIRQAQASPDSRSTLPATPTRTDGKNLPALFDPECDRAIPDRVFSGWIPSDAARAIVRQLTPVERAKVEARAVALRNAVAAHHVSEDRKVKAELAAMLGGFRAMRQQGNDALAMVDVTARVLREFPLWAIAKGCMEIAQNKAELDPRWPPNDDQIYIVVNGIVALYHKHLKIADSLLAAPLEEAEAPRPARADVEAKLGRPIIDSVTTPPSPQPNDALAHGRRTVAVQLAAKQLRLEKLGASPCPCGCPI